MARFLTEIVPELIQERSLGLLIPAGAERREVVERRAYGHPRIKGDAVGHVGDARLDVDFVPRRVEAEHSHLAACRAQQVEQALDRRRLARAVPAEEAVAAAGLDAQVQAIDSVGAAE